MAVGAVYNCATLYVSTICQYRSLSGKNGVPSNITDVAPFASGPYTTYLEDSNELKEMICKEAFF